MADQQPPLEEAIEALRDLADEADADVEQRRASTDMSNPDPSQMAVAEAQGMRKAYQQAWKVAISKREQTTDTDDADGQMRTEAEIRAKRQAIDEGGWGAVGDLCDPSANPQVGAVARTLDWVLNQNEEADN